MSVTDSGTTAAVAQLQKITQVGGVRAFRLVRDTHVRSIQDVAIADVEQLTQVWSIGEWTARVVKESAQAVLSDEREAMDNPQRVAVLTGDETFEDVDGDDTAEAIEMALDIAGIDLDDDDEVGYATEGGSDDRIEMWIDRVRIGGPNVISQPFDIPWEKYATFCADDDDRGWDEKPSLRTNIPFDVDREQDVEWWMAPAERNRNIAQWADHVVIVVEGENTWSVRKACERVGTPCTTAFEFLSAESGLAWPYDDTDLESMKREWEVDDVETWLRTANKRITSSDEQDHDVVFEAGPDGELVINYAESPDGLTIVEAGGEYERDDAVPTMREGTPGEMAPDELPDEMTMEPSHRSEDRSDNGRTGGRGVGSRMHDYR